MPWTRAPKRANPWKDGGGVAISDFGGMRRGESITPKNVGLC